MNLQKFAVSALVKRCVSTGLGIRVTSSQTVEVTMTDSKKTAGRPRRSNLASAISGPLSARSKAPDIFQFFLEFLTGITRDRDAPLSEFVDKFANGYTSNARSDPDADLLTHKK